MSTISIAKLYLFLMEKFGEETSENLTNFIDEKIRSEMENKWSLLATKEDLSSQISAVRKGMAEQKTDLIKWMFVFWIGQMTAIILLFLKK